MSYLDLEPIKTALVSGDLARARALKAAVLREIIDVALRSDSELEPLEAWWPSHATNLLRKLDALQIPALSEDTTMKNEEEIKRLVSDPTLVSDATLRLELARLLGLDQRAIYARTQRLHGHNPRDYDRGYVDGQRAAWDAMTARISEAVARLFPEAPKPMNTDGLRPLRPTLEPDVGQPVGDQPDGTYVIAPGRPECTCKTNIGGECPLHGWH